MGIQDRDYYREGPSFLARIAGSGKVTFWLVCLNVVLFLAQTVTTDRSVLSPGPLDEWFTLDVEKLFTGQVWRALSYAFLHGSIWHLFGNMLFLWWFGRQVEDDLGSREYLIFYLVSAALAGLAFVGVDALVHPPWLKPWVPGRVIGASGGVMAVLLLAACARPRQTIYVAMVLPVPLWVLVAAYVLIDAHGLWQLLSWKESGGVAVAAHLGGAAFGYLYYRNSWRLSGLLGWLKLPDRSRPKLRLYREEEPPRPRPTPAAPRLPAQRAPSPVLSEAPPPRPAPSARLEDEHLEAKVDDILAKVSRVGMAGLTEGERQTLLRASEAMKRRRG